MRVSLADGWRESRGSRPALLIGDFRLDQLAEQDQRFLLLLERGVLTIATNRRIGIRQ